jgi:peptidoglycan/xylan/chitin deacetylase (PgdA/CDA1 family)
VERLPSIRSVFKSGVEAGLLWSGVAWARRVQHRSRTLVLAYHNVAPDGLQPCGDSSPHLPRRHFAEQLDALVRTHDVIPLHELLDDRYVPRRRPRAVITFDDAYRGAVTLGVQELARRGLPATIFVAPAFIGGASFWWDCVSGPEAGEILPPAREQALRRFRGEDTAVRAWFTERGAILREPHDAVAATERELAAAAEHQGITFGSYTWSHPNLALPGSDELRRELEKPLEWLRQRFSNVIPWISYPYGLHSPAVERAAAAAGYHGGLLVTGGWTPAHPRSHTAIPRFNVPTGLSINGFRLRSSGLFCS